MDRGPGCSGHNTFTLRSEPRRLSGPEASLDPISVVASHFWKILLHSISFYLKNSYFTGVRVQSHIHRSCSFSVISGRTYHLLQRCQVQELLFCFSFYFSSRQGFSVYPSISWNLFCRPVWPCTLPCKCWDYRCAHNHYLTGSRSSESLVLVKSLYPYRGKRRCVVGGDAKGHILIYIYSLQFCPYICLHKNLEV